MSQLSISVLMAFKVRNTMMFWTAAVAEYLRLQLSSFLFVCLFVFCWGYLALSSWPLRPALVAEGGCFPGIPPSIWGLYVH